MIVRKSRYAFTGHEAEESRALIARALALPEETAEPGIVWSMGRALASAVASAPLSALRFDGPLPSERYPSYDGAMAWARAAGYRRAEGRDEAQRAGTALREAFRFHLYSGGAQPQTVTALALARAERRAINEGWDLTAELDLEEPGSSEVTLHDADAEPLAGLCAVGGAPSSFQRESGYGRVLYAQLALGVFQRLAEEAFVALAGAAAACARAAERLTPSDYHHDVHTLLTDTDERLLALALRFKSEARR